MRKDWANEPSETAFARRVEEFVHGARLGGPSCLPKLEHACTRFRSWSWADKCLALAVDNRVQASLHRRNRLAGVWMWGGLRIKHHRRKLSQGGFWHHALTTAAVES